MVEVIIAFLTGVLGPISILAAKDYIENRRKRLQDPIAETVFKSNEINEELDFLLEEFSADRIWIAQFHNGGNYYPTGKSIQKFSIFFESLKKPKDSIRANFQGIPVNLFSKSLGKILEDGYIAIYDYREDSSFTCGLKSFAEENGTKSSYLFAIRNLHNKMVGILGVEYTTRKKKIDEQHLISIQLKCNSLGGALMHVLQ